MRTMRSILVVISIIALTLAACTPTGDDTSQPEAAQNLLPNINGYNANSVSNVVSAFTTIAAGASATTGNIPLAAGIARAEVVVNCLQNTGSIAANTYIEASPANIVPEVGMAVVINETRLSNNLLACLLDAGPAAQAVVIEPCVGNGSFTFNGDRVSYVYVGVGERLCGFFAQHFSNLE